MLIAVKDIRPNKSQPRGKLRGIDELADSIAKVGLLQDLVVKKTPSGYELVAGHRRHAALVKLKIDKVECKVIDLADPKLDISCIMAENESRDDLTGKERAAGFQLMIDSGLSDEDMAAITSASAEEIKAARVVRTAKKKLVDKMPDQASLLELQGLTEFDGNDRAYKDLTDLVGKPEFAHRLSYWRHERERVAKVEKATVELKDAGVRIIPREASWDGSALELDGYRMQELKLTPKKHAKCPGHCACIDYQGEIVYCCDKPSEHGLSVSGGSKGPKSEEHKALERKKRRMRALWRASAPVRTEFVTGKLNGKQMPTKLLAWCYAWASKCGIPPFMGHLCTAASFTKSEDSLVRFVAICVAEAEKAFDNWVKIQGSVGPLGANGLLAEYLKVLVELGYGISEHERASMEGKDYEPPVES